MKITVNIDCTPEEARAFFGLPDVAPMQATMPEALMKTWLPASLQGMEELQKMFRTAMADPKKP
jgi:hypothetical protein